MTVQWGILSTALINRRTIPAIGHSLRGNLLGVASRNLSKAKSYAAEWHIPRAYGEYEKLLADQDIQVIYISLPNHLHTEWIIKSLEAGKHVLCEKPMCLSTEEFDSIHFAVERTGLSVMEGFMYLHHPQTKFWKSIIDQGRIGEVCSIQSCFCFNFDRTKDNYRWKADQGGGALWDVGVYPISFFQYLFGAKPKDGFAFTYSENSIDLSTTAMLDFGNNRAAQFFVSFRSAYTTDTVIHGGEGQLYISHPYNNTDICKAYIRRGTELEQLDVPRQYLYSGEVKNMHDIILEGKSPAISLQQSRDVLETVLLLVPPTP